MQNSRFIKKTKDQLFRVIEELDSNKSEFVKNASKDFTRTRKISFQDVIKITMSLGSSCMSKELLDYFNYDLDTATSSAFVQQRDKLLPTAFETLLKQFTNKFDHYKLFKGYRLIGIDGTNINLPHDPQNVETLYQSKPDIKGFNILHLNVMYDLVNKIFIDSHIQPVKKMHERNALITMTNKSELKENVLIVADRGYESYNVFAHIINKNWKFLIRVKDTNSNSILSSLGVPDTGVFDENILRLITRKQTKEIISHPGIYKSLSSPTQFDFLDSETQFYPMMLRVLRIKLDDGSYQCFITNLDKDRFSIEDIKEIYHMRWGVETSFRDLKHTLALSYLHSKKVESIVQEIYAKMTLYNFCSIITSHVVIKKKDKKYAYQVNFSRAISICKEYLRNNTLKNVEALLQKFITPIRNGRSFVRKTKSKTFASFNHRVS